MHPIPRYTLNHIPFMRLLIPLMIGIVWQYVSPSIYTLYIWCGVAIACGMSAWIVRKYTFSTMRKVSFSASVFATFIAIGMGVCMHNIPTHTLPHIDNSTIAIARIEKIPTEQEHSYNTEATIVALNDSSTSHHTNIKIQLNLQKSFTAQSLQGGDLIIFHPELQAIASNSMPYAFDYAQFMARKGILYRQYLADDAWQLSQHKAPATLQYRAMKMQQQCIATLQRCNLSDENIGLLSALLWGYKANLPLPLDNISR